MWLDLVKALKQNGWSLSDIEESSFDFLIKVACSEPEKEKEKKVVMLNDFLK